MSKKMNEKNEYINKVIFLNEQIERYGSVENIKKLSKDNAKKCIFTCIVRLIAYLETKESETFSQDDLIKWVDQYVDENFTV